MQHKEQIPGAKNEQERAMAVRAYELFEKFYGETKNLRARIAENEKLWRGQHWQGNGGNGTNGTTFSGAAYGSGGGGGGGGGAVIIRHLGEYTRTGTVSANGGGGGAPGGSYPYSGSGGQAGSLGTVDVRQITIVE